MQQQSTMAKKPTKETKLIQILKSPIRILIKVRDFYIRSTLECSGRISYGGTVMGCPAGQVSSLPRSFSVSSSHHDDDFSELIRVASTRSLGKKVELELLRRQKSSPAAIATMAGVNVVPRSQSVGIGRIDEDKPCEFVEDVKVKADLYPRSRSYAVSKKKYI